MRNVVTNIVLIVIISTMVPSVSWQGHLGGAIGGALVAVPLNFNHFGRGWQKFAGLLGTVAVPTIGLALAMHYTEQLLTEPQMVLRDLSPAFRIAEETAAQVFNEQVVPILANAGNDIDDAQAWASAAEHPGGPAGFTGRTRSLCSGRALSKSQGGSNGPKRPCLPGGLGRVLYGTG